MLIVITKVASIFSLILVGYVANRSGVLSNDSIPSLTTLMMTITTPCLLVNTMYTKELSDTLLLTTLQTFAGAILYFILATIFVYFAIRVLRLKPREDWGVFILGAATINTGFMGFPITKAIFGTEMVYYMAMHNVFLNIYVMGVGPALLNIGSHAPIQTRKVLKSLVSPIMISIYLGLVLLFTGIDPPQILDEIITMLADSTIPLSMLLVGLQLGASNLKTVFNRSNMLCTLISMVVIPFLAYLIVSPMDFLIPEVKVVLVFATAFPAAVISVALAEQFHKNARVMSELVSLTTLASIVVIPIVAAFLTEAFL